MERMTPDTIDFNSLSKKQLVELVITKYNDCFRLEEENKNLREENKNLTKCNLNLQEWLDNKEKVNKSLREENKKLKSDLAETQKIGESWRQECKQLREELSAYDREFRDEDKKAQNIYKSQKENIFWGKII